MESVEVQLRELPSSNDHADRQTAARWWDGLGKDRLEKLMGVSCPFVDAFPKSQMRGHEKFPEPGKYGWGAYDIAGNLAGFVMGQVDRDTPTEMGFVYMTDPDRQGRGIGSTMLRELIRHETCSSIKTFRCRVFAHNKASLRAIEKAGFVRDETPGDFFYSRSTS
ncbi:GNAT family N-acetyltransferase [Rhodococcus ruber]|uniref:GNAT family N-acetyltransferase n=1 Tax=Rhodococcus ruber TaxID=1830 RepID=UPI0017832135|nr:GNAT family N-acetyltransferase [Rhodococcus ruber]MBD8056447.1 GNAT family N-acetyltransferase [Rhodococcus ruber]